jgi:hypothetical protein
MNLYIKQFKEISIVFSLSAVDFGLSMNASTTASSDRQTVKKLRFHLILKCRFCCALV